jgi:hypothetical protein
MDELMTGLSPQDAADYEAAIDALLAEMNHSNQRMQRDREEIDRLRAETLALRDETRRVIATIGARS